ncbi:MAG: hypothetical protein ACLQQ4_02015 [Bacteroidia bacterium]
MKRVTGISLTFIFLLYLGGLQLFYSLKIEAAKQQSSDLIKSHQITLDNTCRFSFTPDQYEALNWSERNKEFTYNGKHFDIIGIEFYSDKIKVTCFDDSNETSMVAEFTGFMRRMFSQNQSSNDNNNDIANKICKEYLPNLSITQDFFFHVITTIKADCVLVSPSALVADIWHPPSVAC